MAPKSLDMPSTGGFKFISSQLTKPRYPPKETSFAGQTVLITGATSGLGFCCAKRLIELDVAHLILAARTTAKGEKAAGDLRAGDKAKETKITVLEVDMAYYSSVREFARQCEFLDALDVAILNAGHQPGVFELSPEGHEMAMQVNYYSTVLLAFLLLPVLKEKSTPGKPGRLTITNSGTSQAVQLSRRHQTPYLPTFDDASNFDQLENYSSSKALVHYWILRLADRVQNEDVIVNLVDPGLTKGTLLQRNMTSAMGLGARWLAIILGRSVEDGMTTLIDAVAVKGAESHGCNIMDWRIYPYTSRVYDKDGQEIADKVWNETLRALEFAGIEELLRRL